MSNIIKTVISGGPTIHSQQEFFASPQRDPTLNNATATAIPPTITTKTKVSFGVLGAISVTHLINDMMQSVLLALYPVLQGNFHLSFAQVGFITLAFQFSASLLQPVVGLFTDKRPQPFSLPMGMMFTMLGLKIGRAHV